ncbi:hypothetical protein niasHS_010387 [Heterodera schachtii]|uniref:Uncharacterized protein n=1 Tax=Heterodera schachtii TaxID=97005 RepID=A0ABD2J033_HETSC
MSHDRLAQRQQQLTDDEGRNKEKRWYNKRCAVRALISSADGPIAGGVVVGVLNGGDGRGGVVVIMCTEQGRRPVVGWMKGKEDGRTEEDDEETTAVSVQLGWGGWRVSAADDDEGEDGRRT